MEQRSPRKVLCFCTQYFVHHLFASKPARVLLAYSTGTLQLPFPALPRTTEQRKVRTRSCGWTDNVESHKCSSLLVQAASVGSTGHLSRGSSSPGHVVLKSQWFAMPQSCMLDVAIRGPSLTDLLFSRRGARKGACDNETTLQNAVYFSVCPQTWDLSNMARSTNGDQAIGLQHSTIRDPS